MTEDKKTNVIALFKKNAEPAKDSAPKTIPPSPTIQVGNLSNVTARDIHIHITVSLNP